MPRPKTRVKSKASRALNILAPGAVDIHFHGAFGIDLMTADEPELDRLAALLYQNGIAAFCPTTLSCPPSILADAVERLGKWTQSRRTRRVPGQAIPLGIHLEGPFIDSRSCGAHPPGAVRPLDLVELEDLWEKSERTLKILTVAPESVQNDTLIRLAAWAKKHEVVLSLGHSRATQEEAAAAFRAGFSGVTHAWNALRFHHRAPGALGAALGNPRVHLELIVDQVHVAPTPIRWTLALHGKAPICFVSDCVPAAGFQGWTSFGPLRIQFSAGACRLEGGELAGGGKLLTEAYARWVETEASATGQSAALIGKRTLRHVSSDPLRALKLKNISLPLKIRWQFTRNNASFQPLTGRRVSG